MTARWNAALAASLHERLEGLVEPDSRPHPARAQALDSGERLRDRWKTLVANDQDELWARRLSQLGRGADELPELLGPMRAKPGAALPWHLGVESLLRDAHRETAGSVSAPPPQIPFSSLLAPLARAGRQRARRRVGPDNDPLSTYAWTQLEAQLLGRLSAISEPTLGLEFALYRARHRSPLERLVALATNPNADDLYRAFCGGGRLDNVTARYPALARVWAQLVDAWIEVTCELVERIRDDRDELAEFLAIDGPLPEVESIATDLSDRHHGGRTVALLVFVGGKRVVYKPRNIDVETRWGALLTWLSEQGAPEQLVGLGVLPRPEYGWVEVAEPHSCASDADFDRFYRRAGALLCMIWLLAGNDCHRENVIAAGDMPMLVDVETLMHPGLPSDPDASDDAQSVLRHALHHSVLTTGMLPHWFPVHDGAGYESGGIGPGGAIATNVKRWARHKSNTDEDILVPTTLTLPPAQNVPRIGDRYAEPDDYCVAIVAGFVAMARFVERTRDALLAEGGPIAAFAGTKIRVLLRNTKDYVAILGHSLQPESTRSGSARSIAIDALARPVPLDGPAWALIEQERCSLERLDVPRFEIPTDSCEGTWSPHATASGFSISRRRIAALCEGEIKRQTDLIYATFEARSIISMEQPKQLGRPREVHDGSATDAEIRETVAHIVDRVEALATCGANDTATWLTTDIQEATRAFRLRPMGPALYTGTAGVGLFLAAAGVTLDDDRARRLARAAVRTTRQAIAKGARTNMALGGVMGASSIAYALAWMGKLLGDGDMIADATAALLSIDKTEIEGDTHFDLAGGGAGAILAMLAVHSLKPSGELVRRATQCGDHLMAHRVGKPASWPTPDGRRLAGLAHGASGVALSLHRLAAASGAQRFAAAADEALDYERTLFRAEAGNWRDARPDVPEGHYMSSWCNGACGIGMARVGLPETPLVASERDIALRTTIAQGLGSLDHFCCGNVGRAELLLQAGLHHNDPNAVQRSRRLFTAMTERARNRGHWALAHHVHEGSEHAALFRGIAGIGWHGLRQLTPAQLPAIGTLDGSASG